MSTSHSSQAETPELSQAETTKLLIDVCVVSMICSCSTRHIYRLADSGRMPRPVKLGSLVRWNRAEIEDWISAGCPTVRAATRKGVQK
jgi:excisionase family DNA binding protein